MLPSSVQKVNIMNKLLLVIWHWFPFALTVTLICVIVYVVVQQDYRMSANDIPSQLAEDAANSLDKGTDPKALVDSVPVDISTSLSPYIMIFDVRDNVVASSAILDGQSPVPPAGVLKYVRENNDETVSWQPRKGVRQALVLRKTTGGKNYVVAAGHSLRKAEEKISMLGQQIIFGWAVSLGILFVVIGGQQLIVRKK